MSPMRERPMSDDPILDAREGLVHGERPIAPPAGRVLAEAFDERFTESASVPIVATFEAAGPQ